MKTVVKFSKEELEAFKTIASIRCTGITCISCPLSLSNMWSTDKVCYRNISNDLLRGYARMNEEEENNEK